MLEILLRTSLQSASTPETPGDFLLIPVLAAALPRGILTYHGRCVGVLPLPRHAGAACGLPRRSRGHAHRRYRRGGAATQRRSPLVGDAPTRRGISVAVTCGRRATAATVHARLPAASLGRRHAVGRGGGKGGGADAARQRWSVADAA